MEILHKFKENGYFTDELYHLLAKKRLVDPSTEITPSEYIKEMSMSTLERLQNLNNIHVDNLVSCNKSDTVVLSFTPKIIVFQNYKPNDKIVTKFSVKNISKAPTYLNMSFKESSYFFIKPCGKQLLSRLAPGISASFSVTFSPILYEDCVHSVTFYTDVQHYVVPLIAMGPRPIFNIPDSVIIPTVPLKVDSFALVSIQNIGVIPAGFQLSTRSPFSVQPKSVYINPQQKTEVRIGFKTMNIGETAGFVIAKFETGENFWIRVTGRTYVVSIELEKDTVRFLDTYNTLVRQLTYKITNKSDQVLTYMCMKNMEVCQDFEEKVKLATIFYNMKKSESLKDVKLVHYDVLSSDEHDRVYSRIFFDEIQALVADETLYFQNMHFSISPIKGKLWPSKATELTITFNPQEIGEFEAFAYLDVDGVYDRLSLKMVGISLPPTIQLNVETLDMGNVYINKNYNYEIVAVNKGHISGVILYKEIPTLFGSTIICTPLMHCLRPGEKEIFVISFCNSNQGPFFEEINFCIRDTKVILKLYLKGEVCYPSLTFSIPCLDFGKVSLGVPHTMELQVINESTVHVSGSVKISSDGPEVSSITLTDYAVAHYPKPKIPQWPREFNIEPCKINIHPQSRITLKITLTANLVRANQTSLELELEKSDSPPIVLPVLYDAKVPEITPAADIRLRAAFLDFSYTEEITISANEFYGYYTLVNSEEETDMKIRVKKKHGFIKPNSTICLPLTIKTSVLGEHVCDVRIHLFGYSKPITICHISGCGVRPIVTCTPSALHWGQVKLLTRTQKILTLCNDSPVRVDFKTSLLNKDGRWQINPSESFVEPESETDLFVSLFLTDADSYANKVVIQLENVKDIYIPLSAVGVGASIVVGELRDRVALGRHFTKIPLDCKVIMENRGNRLHSLEWSDHYKSPKTKQHAIAFFSLEPRTFKMASGEKLALTITGTSHKVCTIKEMWYLIGSIEGINKKELLMECQIVAEFVDPKVEVSSAAIDFHYDYGPYSEYYKLTDIVTIKNVSKLTLDIEISVKAPFALIQKNSNYIIPPEDENMCCCISYKKSDLRIKNILNETGSHQSEMLIDYLTQQPVEPLRTSSLHFFQDINKIKMAFNLINTIEERLEDQEVMKIQLLFDTTKHTSLKSRVYADVMRVKFKGHKNKDGTKLTGRVNFPNMLVLTPKVDFQCILNSCIESKTIEIQNMTPLQVCYRLQWKKCSITRIVPPPVDPVIDFSVIDDSKSQSTYDFREIMISKDISESLDGLGINKIAPELNGSDRKSKLLTSLAYYEDIDETNNTRILKKVLPMLNPEYDEKFVWDRKFPKFVEYPGINVNDVLQVVPHRGLLTPNEVQYVHVIFKPKPNINVRAILECEVLGGPPEYILVSGQSSDLVYKVNTNKINYKIRSFHTPTTDSFTITNIAQLPFKYRTYLNEPKLLNELEGTISDILPSEKVLESEEEVNVEIVMKTGIVGYFSRTFLLEIGHLPHIPIEIFGWGVIPQVYLSLPRPEIHKLPVLLGYSAIPLLTAEYLGAINEYFSKDTPEHVNSPNPDKCYDDSMFNYGWHICSQWDMFPTTMDIEMAIERKLVIEHVKLKPEILTLYSTSSKMGPIPGFQTTPYVIDYGVVITGSTVTCTTDIINYGPIATKLFFSKGTCIPLWLNVKLCGKLNPGESGKLEVTFSPTSIDFVELEQNVVNSFNLEVPYGVTIPVQVKALCAVPYLTSNVKAIDFGSVRCGNKIILSIPLKNVGKPICIWYVTLKLRSPGPQPMTVLDSSGKYEPGKGGWLSVAFKPTMEMLYEGLLIFRFHMNPTRMTIPIMGQGIVPQVHVIGPHVTFPPTLPWSDTTNIYFGLTNPCPFPIELIIAHSDSKWKEEEAIYNLLNKYYSKPDEMLVPAITPGKGLPNEVVQFYTRFNENIQKAMKEEAAAQAKAMSARAATTAVKKGKSPKGTPKVTTGPQQPNVKKFRTEAEIIADEIKLLKGIRADPLEDCKQIFDNAEDVEAYASDKDKHTKGLIVFAHGSPGEEIICQEMAYYIGKALGLPTVNIDLCIVEALCVCEGSARNILFTALNESFYWIKKTENKMSVGNEASEGDLEENEDEFESVYKKIEYLAITKNAGTPRSKASDKKKKKDEPNSSVSQSVLDAMGSSTMFHIELILELLTEYFSLPKFDRGFIVDNLTSEVLKSPSTVMSTVLKSKHSIRNIHLILCHSDFSKWVQRTEEAQRENELPEEVPVKVYSEEEIKEIIEQFEEMDAEEFDNAPQELKEIYKTHGLEERRQKHKKSSQINEVLKKEKVKESKLTLKAEGSDSKKKIPKKEETKGKPPSEFVLMNAKYTEYNKNVFDSLINIANNWAVNEAELGYPLISFNGQVVGSTQKKAKKKSEELLQYNNMDSDTSDRGFPLTFIMSPTLQFKEALVKRFMTSPIVVEALKINEEFDILKSPANTKEFTVLIPKTFPTLDHEESLRWRFLEEPKIKKCECNPLADLHILDDSNQENVIDILSKWYCTCGKKVTSSQTSTTEIPFTSAEKTSENSSSDHELYPSPMEHVKSSEDLQDRIVLQSGDLVRCKYSFDPQVEGIFGVTRYVEVSGWPESRVNISVTAICDVPRLDSRPKKMFENFTRKTIEEHVYKVTYLDDQKKFEFGPIFIGANRIYEEEYSVDLKNSSLITADLEIEFFEETSVFTINEALMSLEPGCRSKLVISAAPAEVGIHSSVLLFCVGNNPEIVAVTISCSGVVPIVEILPLTKIIDYGKLLLYRRENDRFIVKNDTVLPVKWKIRNIKDFEEDFIIAKTSGIVPRYDNQVVPLTYIASRVGVITNRPLIIDIYDAEVRGEPMLSEILFLSAECYDVQVACAYDDPTETSLNYGNVKVNSTVVKDMYLLNRGKYCIYYKLKKVKNFPEPSLLKSFEATTETGMVLPTLKMVTIEFECTPTTSMNLVNVPVYICTLLDGSKNQVVVAEFPVCVTIASFYNTFTLFPLGELNFHIIPVGSAVMREVILNNTSKCPVTYEIELPPQYRIDPNLPPPVAKTKDNKIKNPPMRCGNFTIVNDDNLLAPGTSRTLQIQFFASAAKKFEETVKFIISDTCPAEAQGVPLRLVGIGAIPTLDLWNLETTFREHLIVKNLSEYKVPEASPHCVFVEDSVTLHFFSVTVNTSYTGAIDLYNNGLVACALALKLHYQSNSDPEIFSLDKYETHIEPLMHKNLDIIFSPKALTEYRAVLEIKLKLLDSKELSSKICLIGEGVIPRIQMIYPAVRQHRISLLRFPVTCLGSVSVKHLKFKNISTTKSEVYVEILQPMRSDRPVFWLTAGRNADCMNDGDTKDNVNKIMKVLIKPAEIATVNVNYHPMEKGKINCEVKLTIVNNPYEHFTVLCEAEAFIEDVILIGLEMMSVDADLESYKQGEGTSSTASAMDSRKKSRSAPTEKKKAKPADKKIKEKSSQPSIKTADTSEPAVLKYLLDFGGCELLSMQKRSVIMVNNSDKVYKFIWEEIETVIVKPSMGYISPGEEKDLEILFYSVQPVTLQKELLNCMLTAVNDESLTLDTSGVTWDNRQIVTLFDRKRSLNERYETIVDEQAFHDSGESLGSQYIVIVYSATTEYTKYNCTLRERMVLRDTFIYQTRTFSFKVENVGKVAMKIAWEFLVDDEYPSRIHANQSIKNKNNPTPEDSKTENEIKDNADSSKVTLFSEDSERNSVDTWFEMDLPFKIEPVKDCLKPKESRVFKVTFAPLEAFDYKVRLKCNIDNLDPYDQNASCKIRAKSLIPYVHLDIEESDYLTAGRRKVTGVVLPPHMTVLEFNVLGSGCYKKAFNVINPTSEGYEFNFEMVLSDKPELIPVHCNKLKGFVEGGTSTEVEFTFSPTSPGVFESNWKFLIPVHSLVMNLLVVGLVRESDVVFIPTILIKKSLVGFTTTSTVMLKNNEQEALKFEFKGNSLNTESGKTPVVVQPEAGLLKPRSETPINIIYTPIHDGPLSFKIFCAITHMTKWLTLCVNALSHSINPKVTYYIIGNEHLLGTDCITNIHLEQTASTYERTVPFTIKNDGSATFFFDWHYSVTFVKKYLNVRVKPKSGHVSPGNEVECILHFDLKQVPVHAFPVSLMISDGPEYKINLYADIKKPMYRFTTMEHDFEKCVVNAPDTTYKKNLALYNDDEVPIIVNLNFSNLPELYVEYDSESLIYPTRRMKIAVYFRPKQVREYEFKLQFWVNSLCEEIITIKGEGVPLLFDLYEGCQKSFDMGPVKVGEKIVRSIEVMNHSKVPIDATFIFRDMYPVIEDNDNSEGTSVCLTPTAVVNGPPDVGLSRVKMLQHYRDDKIREQISMDIQNALSSLKVIPNKCTINPHRKVPLKIQFKPVGLISILNVQLNMKVFEFERPLVRLSGSATGMSLCLSQSSLQFGRVRKRGCKILKVMLMNKGDFGAKFWWQPLITEEFKISPLQGNIAAHSNVSFTITFRPVNHNPFIKVWASCNIENYMPLELAMYASCVEFGSVQIKNLLFMECPVREVQTDYVVVTNPSDDVWLVLSEVSGGGPFETLKEFNVEPNSTFQIPIHFKPKTIGPHEGKVLYSPLGESALFVNVLGAAKHPNPNGTINLTVPAKEFHTAELLVHNITEFPESYLVSTEIIKVIPDKFNGYYELKYPDTVKVWGEASATCRWKFVCYEECEMHLKVVFINEDTRQYQFYNIIVTVIPSEIAETITFVSRARESVQKEVVIANPLSKELDFYIKCEQIICPEVVKIGKNSEATLTLTYSPLVVGETEENLEVSNPLVGSYVLRIIKMKCLPAKEKDLEFTTPFGNSIPIRLRVQNNTDTKAVFDTTVSHSSIQAEKEYYLGPSEKGKFLVWFEPMELGVQNCKISFNSVVAGEFVFNIKGIASNPKPQGPYNIKLGGSTLIKFKNVFEDTRTFKIYIDKEDFFVKSFYETIKGKKDVRIAVYLTDSQNGTPGPLPTGCLNIETCDPVDPKVHWTFFLQGTQ